MVVLRRKIRSFSRRVFGKPDLLEALAELDAEGRNTPRSLNGCDSLLLPKILQDFPDFDATLAKTYVQKYLKDALGTKPGFTVHKTAIAKYLPSGAQRTIVYQAAVSWTEAGKREQKRFDVHYTHLLSSSEDSVAANCPNCGAALGYGVTVCPYCDSRVANVMGNCWTITQCTES